MITVATLDEFRLVKDIGENARVTPIQLQQWVDDAVRITQRVANGDDDLAPLFWIRVYGILHDVYQAMTSHRDSRNQCIEAGTPVPPVATRVWDAKDAVADAIQALLKIFDERELTYFEYRRHTEAHPLQHKYRLRRRRNGLTVVRCSLLDGREIAVEEFSDIAHKVIAAYPSELAIAIAWAKRSLPQVQAVADAVTKWRTTE